MNNSFFEYLNWLTVSIDQVTYIGTSSSSILTKNAKKIFLKKRKLQEFVSHSFCKRSFAETRLKNKKKKRIHMKEADAYTETEEMA